MPSFFPLQVGWLSFCVDDGLCEESRCRRETSNSSLCTGAERNFKRHIVSWNVFTPYFPEKFLSAQEDRREQAVADRHWHRQLFVCVFTRGSPGLHEFFARRKKHPKKRQHASFLQYKIHFYDGRAPSGSVVPQGRLSLPPCARQTVRVQYWWFCRFLRTPALKFIR